MSQRDSEIMFRFNSRLVSPQQQGEVIVLQRIQKYYICCVPTVLWMLPFGLQHNLYILRISGSLSEVVMVDAPSLFQLGWILSGVRSYTSPETGIRCFWGSSLTPAFCDLLAASMDTISGSCALVEEGSGEPELIQKTVNHDFFKKSWPWVVPPFLGDYNFGRTNQGREESRVGRASRNLYKV